MLVNDAGFSESVGRVIVNIFLAVIDVDPEATFRCVLALTNHVTSFQTQSDPLPRKFNNLFLRVIVLLHFMTSLRVASSRACSL